VHLVFDVDQLAMDAKSTEDAESVRSMEDVVEEVIEAGDVVVSHTTSIEEEGQPNRDYCCEVHQCEEARGRSETEERKRRDLKKNSDLWSAMKRLRHQSKAKSEARLSSK
jgi:hypothetical protein